MMVKGKDRFGDCIRWVGREEIRTLFDVSRAKWRLIRDGRQTFYNNQNQMMEWDTEQQAIDWLEVMIKDGWLPGDGWDLGK